MLVLKERKYHTGSAGGVDEHFRSCVLELYLGCRQEGSVFRSTSWLSHLWLCFRHYSRYQAKLSEIVHWGCAAVGRRLSWHLRSKNWDFVFKNEWAHYEVSLKKWLQPIGKLLRGYLLKIFGGGMASCFGRQRCSKADGYCYATLKRE